MASRRGLQVLYSRTPVVVLIFFVFQSKLPGMRFILAALILFFAPMALTLQAAEPEEYFEVIAPFLSSVRVSNNYHPDDGHRHRPIIIDAQRPVRLDFGDLVEVKTTEETKLNFHVKLLFHASDGTVVERNMPPGMTIQVFGNQMNVRQDNKWVHIDRKTIIQFPPTGRKDRQSPPEGGDAPGPRCKTSDQCARPSPPEGGSAPGTGGGTPSGGGTGGGQGGSGVTPGSGGSSGGGTTGGGNAGGGGGGGGGDASGDGVVADSPEIKKFKEGLVALNQSMLKYKRDFDKAVFSEKQFEISEKKIKSDLDEITAKQKPLVQLADATSELIDKLAAGSKWYLENKKQVLKNLAKCSEIARGCTKLEDLDGIPLSFGEADFVLRGSHSKFSEYEGMHKEAQSKFSEAKKGWKEVAKELEQKSVPWGFVNRINSLKFLIKDLRRQWDLLVNQKEDMDKQLDSLYQLVAAKVGGPPLASAEEKISKEFRDQLDGIRGQLDSLHNLVKEQRESPDKLTEQMMEPGKYIRGEGLQMKADEAKKHFNEIIHSLNVATTEYNWSFPRLSEAIRQCRAKFSGSKETK